MSEVANPAPQGGTTDPPANPGNAAQGQVSWRDSLPEDLRANPSLSTIGDVTTLAKNYIETKSFVGKKGIIPPGENATPEQLNEFYAAVGRPETPEAYEFAAVDLPENFPASPEMEKAFRSKAHELGISGAQAKGLHQWFMEANVGQYKQMMEANSQVKATAEAQLRKDWGTDYEKNIEAANLAIRQFGDDVVQASIANRDEIWSDPRLARFLAGIGKAMAEHEFIGGSSPGGSSLEAQRKQLMMDPAYTDKKDPRHNDVVEKVWNLSQRMNPTK